MEFKKLFLGSFIVNIGMALNFLAVRLNANSCRTWYVPVMDKTARAYLITDIIPTIIDNFYISIGDVLITIGIFIILVCVFKK